LFFISIVVCGFLLPPSLLRAAAYLSKQASNNNKQHHHHHHACQGEKEQDEARHVARIAPTLDQPAREAPRRVGTSGGCRTQLRFRTRQGCL
jgi:hypothetical protein